MALGDGTQGRSNSWIVLVVRILSERGLWFLMIKDN